MMIDVIANWYFYIILVLVTWVVVLTVVIKAASQVENTRTDEANDHETSMRKLPA